MLRTRRTRKIGVAVALAVALGIASLVAAEFLMGVINANPRTEQANGRTYFETVVTVPANATQTSSIRVVFHSTSFVLWWPPPPPAGTMSSGVNGVSISITESSGVTDNTGTGCGDCGRFVETWFSPDSNVGIQYEASPAELGAVTLLVAD